MARRFSYVSSIDVLYNYLNEKQCTNALVKVFTQPFFVYWNLLRASEFGYVITVTIFKERFLILNYSFSTIEIQL